MLNGGITSNISLSIFVHQGCPLSPLLIVIVIHNLLVMLSRLAMKSDIVGLYVPSRGQLVAKALADHYFMFL